MKVFVFFDLPTLTAQDRRNYRLFVKKLKETGFVMIQKSVYCKTALNGSNARVVAKQLKTNAPPKGLVSVLLVTEHQFAHMEYITGKAVGGYIQSAERFLRL